MALSEAGWSALAVHAERVRPLRVDAMLERDPSRVQQLTLRHGPLRLDASKQRVDRVAFDALLAAADIAGLPGAIADLLAGANVNRTERRPALHSALRAPLPAADARGVAADAARSANEALARLRGLVEQLRSGPQDTRATDLVHVGIGGSDLGPRLVCDALAAHAGDGPRVHFVANVDGEAVTRAIRGLDPRRTIVSLVSKSFTTQETLLNGRALREWLSSALAPEQVSERLVAVTANVAAASELGVRADRVLPLWDWVGGRYSLWGAVGFPVALACGFDVFRSLLDGAHAMDRHYAQAPLHANLPLWMALLGIWNRNLLGLPTLAVIPYDERLRLLPAFLQQLEMESNGKRVDEHGHELARAAAPVIWGDVGSNAQHAFFQSLHQGVDDVAVDLLGVARPGHALRANHDALLANLVAQSAALLCGTGPDVPAERQSPGNRPHSVLLLDELTPESLGMLLAAYEHKVHAQGVFWGVDSFDQWGVELGKKIASQLLPAIEGGEVPAGTDASSATLLRELRSLRRR